MKKFFIFLLIIGLGAHIYLYPSFWGKNITRVNNAVVSILGGKKPEYSPAKAYFVTTEVYVYAFREKGTILLLTDGSIWEVRDPSVISNWSIGDTIRVDPANDSRYPYMLNNTQRQTRVNASYNGTQ